MTAGYFNGFKLTFSGKFDNFYGYYSTCFSVTYNFITVSNNFSFRFITLYGNSILALKAMQIKKRDYIFIFKFEYVEYYF